MNLQAVSHAYQNRCHCAVCRGNRKLFRRERAKHAREHGLYVVPQSQSQQPQPLISMVDESEPDSLRNFHDNEEDDGDIPDPILDDDEYEGDCNDGETDAGNTSGEEISPSLEPQTPDTPDRHSTRNPLTRFLFSWASKFALGDKAMSALLQGLSEFDCTGGFYVPKDFRTVHSAFVNESEDDVDVDESESVSGVTIKFFCEACSMHEFEKVQIDAKQPCLVCNVDDSPT